MPFDIERYSMFDRLEAVLKPGYDRLNISGLRDDIGVPARVIRRLEIEGEVARVGTDAGEWGAACHLGVDIAAIDPVGSGNEHIFACKCPLGRQRLTQFGPWQLERSGVLDRKSVV